MYNSLSSYWFRFLTSRFLIYNTCWEDPAIDRELLQINEKSDLLMITSAGDNAFDYLLDEPGSVDCVDINPYQNALFDFKKACYMGKDRKNLSELFLTGKSTYYQDIYSSVSSFLKEDSLRFWNQHIHWFASENGFYKNGLTGRFSTILNTLINVKGLRGSINQLLGLHTIEQREALFRSDIEPHLWNGFSKYLWKSNLMLSLAGVPLNQKQGMRTLNEHIKTVLWNIFVVQNPVANYFWRLYLNGLYHKEALPNYLKEENFKLISSQIPKLSSQTISVKDFLSKTSKKYSHFILLDHQDWFIGNGTNELEQEWQAILKSAKPKAKVLMRSVYPDLGFLPCSVKERVSQIPVNQEFLKLNDRVGTYPSTFLMELHV